MIREMAKLDVDEATKEVKSKSKQQIDIETAYKWASRSIACLQIQKQTTDPKEKVHWADLADDFRHEAMEHAATSDDGGKTLKEVTELMDKALKA